MDRLLRKIRPLLLSWLRRSRSGKLPLLQHFSYKDIKTATDGFHRVIYSNSHGAAYKARFRDGKLALVKEVKGCEDDQDVFYREVQLLGRLHHRHLLALKGYSTGSKRLLVFDNIDNGTLKEHLNDPLRTPLNWNARLRIAFGVVAALEYLLLFTNPPIYDVSISSSNIMLDDNFIAKLSEVSIINDAQRYVKISNGSSSEGYSQNSGNIVFQLGVLILELVTGQASEKGNADLIEWIQESRLGNSIHRMIDPDLGNDYNSKELRNLLAIARLCIESKDEPKFSVPQIFRYLQKKVDISCS